MDTLIVIAGILPALALVAGFCAYEMDLTRRRIDKFTDHLVGKDSF